MPWETTVLPMSIKSQPSSSSKWEALVATSVTFVSQGLMSTPWSLKFSPNLVDNRMHVLLAWLLDWSPTPRWSAMQSTAVPWELTERWLMVFATSSIQLLWASKIQPRQPHSQHWTVFHAEMSSTIAKRFWITCSHNTMSRSCNGSVPSHNCSDGRRTDSESKDLFTSRRWLTAHQTKSTTTATWTPSSCSRLGINVESPKHN